MAIKDLLDVRQQCMLTALRLNITDFQLEDFQELNDETTSAEKHNTTTK